MVQGQIYTFMNEKGPYNLGKGFPRICPIGSFQCLAGRMGQTLGKSAVGGAGKIIFPQQLENGGVIQFVQSGQQFAVPLHLPK